MSGVPEWTAAGRAGLLVLLISGCRSPVERHAQPGTTTVRGASDDSRPPESGTPPTDDTGTQDSETPGGPCPREMALTGFVCIDRWEAALEGWSPYEVPDGGVAYAAEGVMPQGYISGDIAAVACENAGKRLCTQEEWERACQGPDQTTYPYGDRYDADACNDSRDSHPVTDYFGTSTGVWDGEHMNDPGINQQPDTEDAAGANPDCVSAEGVYDLHGNLHEWIDDANGTFKGGFYADAVINGAGCSYTTTAHTTSYHDYSTGFRCCADPR